jgi:hypothetical protein
MIKTSATLALIFLATTFSGNPSYGAEVNWVKALAKKYRMYPSSRVLTDSTRLIQTMKLVDPLAANMFKDLCVNQHSKYEAARAAALKIAGKPKPTWGKAEVVGLSGGGSTASRVLSESGYQVEAYESRANPTREVQWGARQSMLDAMHFYFGPEVGNQFYQNIALPIGKAYKHMDHNFEETSHPLPEKRAPNPPSIIDSMTGLNIVSTSSVAAITVKDAEAELRQVASRDSNIHLHIGDAAPSFTRQADGRFSLTGSDKSPPDIIVLAEGAGRKVSSSMGFKSTVMSPERLQVAGVIHTDIPGGNAIGSEMRLPGSDFTIVSGSLHREGSGKVWFVTDLDPKAVTPGPNFHPDTPEYKQERARLVESHYRNIASFVLKIPPQKMKSLEITGATGGALQEFKIQLGLTKKAVQGNVIQMGDTVGNGHWSVGAGAMMAMTAHPDGLANYLNDIQRGVDPRIAKETLNRRLIADTGAWIRGGISRFWPDLKPQDVTDAYDRAVKIFNAGGGDDFQKLLELEVSKIHPNSRVVAKDTTHAAMPVSSRSSTEVWEVAFGKCFKSRLTHELVAH